MRRTINDRLVAVGAGMLALLGVLWVRCVWLQVVQAGSLRRIAESQHYLSRVLRAPRGVIYDQQGRVLAMSMQVPSVFANPRLMHDKSQTAARLAKVLARNPQMVMRRLDRDKGFVWVARHVDLTLTDQLQAFRRDGIGLQEEVTRVYPQGDTASHLVGIVNIDQQGLEGLELAFNGALRGRSGWQATARDAKGDLLTGPWTATIEPQPGYNVVLTVDSVVQEVVEEALAWGVEKFHAKGGSIIVIDPQSGAILAMANAPRFDANAPGRVPAAARRNRAITDLFEPGSVFKIVTASALLEEGAIRPDERVFCEEGAYHTIGHHILHDHTGHGWLTFHDVIKYSSNIGTVKAAQRLSPEALYRYIKAFGFGRKTGIELPGEISGLINPPARWSKLSPYVIPIGQEVGVTPIQLAVMISTIANGGRRVHPYVVDRIQTAEGTVVRMGAHRTPEPLLSRATAQHIEEMLVSVVESGTGQLANVQGLTVAGKTGTAQKIEPTGRYSHSLFVASFVGYGPVPDPRFAMVVSIDEPHPLYFGGVVAAPIFRRVVERLASYWDLTPAAPAPALAQLPSSP